jgi:hypothetical protein
MLLKCNGGGKRKSALQVQYCALCSCGNALKGVYATAVDGAAGAALAVSVYAYAL